MSKFPEIEQFRHVIRRVTDHTHFTGMVTQEGQEVPSYDRTKPLPTVSTYGTVKIHGTNGGVRLTEDGALEVWSRTRVITPGDDNAGFAKFVMEREAVFLDLLQKSGRWGRPMLYGEWCGEGIMKGCAVHQLPKMFVIFAISSTNGEDRKWLDIRDFGHIKSEADRVFNVTQFGVYPGEIDFAHPAETQNALVALTAKVEAECPVGAYFGVKGVGEGIVWHLAQDVGEDALDEESEQFHSSDFWFKVKGAKHSVTKVKKLAEVDLELLKTTREFAEATATEQRCLQAVEFLKSEGKPLDQTSTGDFLRWMFNDVIKEESDRMEASGLDKKGVGAAVSKHARTWWFAHLNKEAGL